LKGGLKLTRGKNIRKWLLDHDRTLTWLWQQVQRKGFKTLHYDRFTRIINGKYTGGNSAEIIEAAEQVIDEHDEKRSA
jgi:hypothetical protein